MSNWSMINNMSCSYRDYYFYEAMNSDTFQYTEYTSSTNSVHHLCQTQHEVDNRVVECPNFVKSVRVRSMVQEPRKIFKW